MNLSLALEPDGNLHEPIAILGSGAVTPARVLTSAECDARCGLPIGHLERRTGIASRCVATSETSVGMAVEAARLAVADAALAMQDIDLILSAAAVPAQPIPAMGPAIQRGLGLLEGRTASFDINSTCLSFLTAFDLAASWLRTGRARHILIVSSEIASRALPWNDDPETAALFGDGAAAVVVGKGSGSGGLAARHMVTLPEGYDDCELAAGGTRFSFMEDREAFETNAIFRMEGKAVFKRAAAAIEPFLAELLGKSGWNVEDVELLIPHQASRLALDHLVRRVGIPKERVVDIMAEHGNQIAASLPTALHHARQAGLLPPGRKVVMVGTSAGLSIAGLALVT